MCAVLATAINKSTQSGQLKKGLFGADENAKQVCLSWSFVCADFSCTREEVFLSFMSIWLSNVWLLIYWLRKISFFAKLK